MKWKPATQARANRVGRGNYSSRYVSHGEPTFDAVSYVQSPLYVPSIIELFMLCSFLQITLQSCLALLPAVLSLLLDR